MLIKFTTVPTKNLPSIFAFQDLKSQASKFSDGQWGSKWTDHVNAQLFNSVALDQIEMSQVDAVVRILASFHCNPVLFPIIEADYYTFLWNWPPTPPLSQHKTLTSHSGQNVGLGEG